MISSGDAPLRESDLQDAIVETARLLGWRVMHTRPARLASGQWRTPIQGHAGFPDLVLLRGDRLLIAELKAQSGRLTSDQELWLDAFDHVPGVETFVWTPRHWRSGVVTELLR